MIRPARQNCGSTCRASALHKAQSGERPIVPGKPQQSEMISRIFSTDADEVMPPPAVRNPLSEADKQILARWIAAGAEYKPLLVGGDAVPWPGTGLQGHCLAEAMPSMLSSSLGWRPRAFDPRRRPTDTRSSAASIST